MARFDMTISVIIDADDEEEAIEKLNDLIGSATPYELHDARELEF